MIEKLTVPAMVASWVTHPQYQGPVRLVVYDSVTGDKIHDSLATIDERGKLSEAVALPAGLLYIIPVKEDGEPIDFDEAEANRLASLPKSNAVLKAEAQFRLRATHYPVTVAEGHRVPYCVKCLFDWPCDTAIVVSSD